VPEKETKEKPPQPSQPQASLQSQYIPDKTLRKVCLETADKPEEKKK
jgi:hypothetical protein